MHNKNIKLFVVSFAMLFLEIFLIRWISTEIRIFAYVNNLVLLACFLGIGIGCYYSKKRANVNIAIIMLTFIALAVQLGVFKNITSQLSGFSDSVIWDQTLAANTLMPVFIGVALTLVIFIVILTIFIPLGQILGKLLSQYNNIIQGYSINILASLAGIWFFNLCSFFYTPPWVWFTVSSILLLFLVQWTTATARVIAISCSILILFFSSLNSWYRKSLLTVWSPYQKLDVYYNIEENIANGYVINVNNVGYMTLLDLSDDFFKQALGQSYNLSNRQHNQYELPFRFTDSKEEVLIVGAGAGNDVAGAIRSGAKHIDAVEIDPGVYNIGFYMHPEQPYQNNNVKIFIDDARAFFKKAEKGNKKYDIACFGLLDSHTLSSNYNNMRLDHYVYTKESFQEVKKILSDNGVLSVIFQAQRRWLEDRIYGLLNSVFGEVPYIFEVRSPYGMYGWGGVMYITGNNLEKLKERVESNRPLADYINKNSVKEELLNRSELTLDDWPYLYIERRAIPRMHILIISIIILLLFVVNRLFIKTVIGKTNLHFFFLGSAFLLLEFQNVSKSALLFGSTWIANSVIISSILILILLANLFVYYSKIRRYEVFYLFLLLSILVVYFVPLDIFNIFTYWPKAFLASFFINVPVFFAGVIFINSFKRTTSKDTALGSNLIGAAVGGVLETLSFIVGIKPLLLLVFILYAASLFYAKRIN
jgi:spermidine synthase